MLKGVSLALALRADVVSVVGRKRERLSSLQEEARAGGGCRIHPISVDYRDTRGLLQALLQARQRFGPIGPCVVWIHSTAPEAPLAIAGAVATPVQACPYFHLLSSQAVDPASPERGWRTSFEQFPRIEYHEVILGFVQGPEGSRWLTHREVCEGVMTAIEMRVPRFIIGTVTPWSARP